MSTYSANKYLLSSWQTLGSKDTNTRKSSDIYTSAETQCENNELYLKVLGKDF